MITQGMFKQQQLSIYEKWKP